jgi:hypothetical protein
MKDDSFDFEADESDNNNENAPLSNKEQKEDDFMMNYIPV